MIKKRINKIIDLLKSNQPVYYTSTSKFTFANGKKMSKTWADYIRLDCEHGSTNFDKVGDYMRGLVAGGNTRSGHRTPAVLAELPFPGSNKDIVEYNSWIINQLLGKGVHGLILCHAEEKKAVQSFVKSSRFTFRKNILPGRRGHGGHKFAMKIWGVEEREYVEKCDPWPLNPAGEMILGIKMENIKAVKNSLRSSSVPGVCFGEYGLGDLSMDLGYKIKPTFPLPRKIAQIRKKVWDNCKKNRKYFLGIIEEKNYKHMLDNGMMFCRAYQTKVVSKGRNYTKRKKPW